MEAAGELWPHQKRLLSPVMFSPAATPLPNRNLLHYSHAAFLIHFCAVDFLLNRVVSLATLIWRQQGRRAIHVRHFSPDAEEPKAAFFMHSMCDHVGL